MICEVCGKEKDENTVLCTNCSPQCECGGSCSSKSSEKKREKTIVENIRNKFRRGYTKE